MLMKNNSRHNSAERPLMLLFILILLSFPNSGCNNEQSRQANEGIDEVGLEEIVTFLGNRFVEKTNADQPMEMIFLAWGEGA